MTIEVKDIHRMRDTRDLGPCVAFVGRYRASLIDLSCLLLRSIVSITVQKAFAGTGLDDYRRSSDHEG